MKRILLTLSAALVSWSALAEDWPTYRHDNARSGITSETLLPPLSECWVYQPRHAPAQAWGDPNPRPRGGWYTLREQRRVHFDDAFHVVAAGEALYFGSSADGQVRSLDATTGQPRWTFLTDGPVRLAPALWQERLYFASDDGYAYCLEATDGNVVWRVRAAPGLRKLLGSGKMVSLWPSRTGVLVADDTAYFGAGIFPAEGVVLNAVRATDGQLLWRNDTCGEAPMSRVSPQGYLLASATTLFAPMGRTPPAAFDRQDGRLLHEAYFGHRIGGTYALLAEDILYTGTEEMMSYNQKTRGQFAWFAGRQLIVTGDTAYMTSDTEMVALRRTEYAAASLRRFALRDQRPAQQRQLDSTKRQHADLTAKVKQDRDALAAVNKQVAGARTQGKDAEVAALGVRHAALEKSLAENVVKLEDAAKALEQQEASWQAMEEEWTQADKTMTGSENWRLACTCPDALILAGSVLYAGGANQVIAVNAETGEQLWAGAVDGRARGLAVANGRLFVSTDKGLITCFAPKGVDVIGPVRERVSSEPYPRDALTPVFEAAADHIVETTGVTRGYCLVLGAETGRLVYELSKRTELHVCAVEPDPEKAQQARKRLAAAGLYGTRVSIEQAGLSSVPFADYFANLIVSEAALVSGKLPPSTAEAFRMLKPVGGKICIGQPPEADGLVKALRRQDLESWLAAIGSAGAEVAERDGLWLTATRGPLPGAGGWTHQYAEPGNTACGDDQLVKCPLGLLWFGAPGPGKMASRNRRPAAPLALDGRLFVQGEGTAAEIGAGETVIMAYDAYNGLKLWERPFPPGTIRDGMSYEASNLATDGQGLLVVSGAACTRLDAATGDVKGTYAMPPPAAGLNRRWGYLAAVDGLLFGTRTQRGRNCDAIFALDAATGTCRWEHSVRNVPHSSISIAAGKLYFIDDNVTPEQCREALRDRLAGMSEDAAAAALKAAPVRLAVALDVATGAPVWQRPVDLTGALGGGYWHALATMVSKEVMVIFGVFTDGHYWQQFFADHFKTRRVVALSGRDGHQLWAEHIGYRVRPLIVGDTFHAEPWSYDLHTGRQKRRANPLTGRDEVWQLARPGHHCGCPAASPHTMLFRSHTIAYYDLVRDQGIMHFGAQRPSCWINFIPANGLLLIPEGGSACMCPFPNSCTLVFQHREYDRAWAYFSAPGPVLPVKHLALNLGAPGDRKDDAGTLWLGWPRPGGALVLQFKASLRGWPGSGYFKRDRESVDIAGTPSPWLYRSGHRGLRACEIPLFPPEEGVGLYSVRLGFAELDDARPGDRVFDIKLNGKTVLAGFDPVADAGGAGKAVVKEFADIEGAETLLIELVPTVPKPAVQQLPILQTVELIRDRVLALGFAAPSFLLNHAEPRQSGDVRIANHKDEPFTGTLHVAAPAGFTVVPADIPVEVASGAKLTVTLTAHVAGTPAVGDYTVEVKLVRDGGQIECEQRARIEFLGDRGRVVLTPVEDAHCQQSNSTRNVGTDPSLNIDGGDRKLGDHHHSVAYLKFRLDLPGKPVSFMLRLFNSGNPTGDSGRICLVTEPWSEKTITYVRRPQPGQELVKIGPVRENQVMELPFELAVDGKGDVSLVIDPTGCDGVGYYSREGLKPPELVVEYQR